MAKQKGVIVEDCQKVDKYVKKLDPKIVADLKRFNVSSVDELLSFCVAKLNRANEGDAKAAEVKQAFLLQVAKDIGAMACVLNGKVDQIVITGGIAYGEDVVAKLKERCGWIAPVTVYPGEDELLALAQGALRVMNGEEQVKQY